MARISLWKDYKDRDYAFIDRQVGEYLLHSGTGVLLHKYIGPSSGGDETTIQDVLFLENRSRKYDPNIYEMRGHYQPQSSEFDLTQFGIYISNDIIFIVFHYNTMIEQLGRKIMSGDVFELPHVRDPDTLNTDDNVLNRYYVVQDASLHSEGFGAKWYGHIWRVKAQQMNDQEEFSDIINGANDGILVDQDGNEVGPAGCPDICTSLSKYSDEIAVTDKIVQEAISNVKFDPNWWDASNFWITEKEDGTFDFIHNTGDGIPPNGYPLKGQGTEFPLDMEEGEFFLRTDFNPDVLFRKIGTRYIKIEQDIRRKWTPVNITLDDFLNNNSTTTNNDCTVTKVKQAISKAVKPKVNAHQDKLDELYGKK